MVDSIQHGINKQSFGRALTYILVVLVFAIGAKLFDLSQWRSSPQFHTMLEVMASMLAVIVGTMALVRYFSRASRVFLFVGSGILGAAFLDGYHAVVTSSFFQSSMPSDFPSLIPWSWFVSRFYLSIFMLLAAVSMKDGEQVVGERESLLIKYGVGSAVFALLCTFYFAFGDLPAAYYPDQIIHRPYDLLPAIILFAALVVSLRSGMWKDDSFQNWFTLSLVIGTIGQVVYMPFSSQLFDAGFDISHLLKIASYGLVLIGLLFSMYSIFRSVDVSEDRFQLAFEATESGVFDWNFRRNTAYFSSRFFEILQFDSPSMLKHPDDFFKIVHPVDRERILGIYRGGIEQKKSMFNEQHRVVCNDGHVIWVQTMGVITFDEFGEPERVVGTFKDISEVKEAEEYRRIAENRMGQLIEQAADAIISLDQNFKIQIFNRAAEKIFGYSKNEMVGKSIDMLLPDGVASNHANYMKNFAVSGETVKTMGNRDKISGKHKNGREFPAEASITVLRDASGPIYTVMLRDITKHVEAERALIENERRFRAIVDNSPAKIHIKDLDGNYLLVNPEIKKLLKATEEEVVGKNIDQFVDIDNLIPFMDHDNAVLESGGVVEREEYWNFNQEGRTYLTVKFPIRNAQGNITSIGAIGTDITDRKRNEELIKEKVKELESVNQELAEFNYVASHDLQEPLRTLSSYSKLLADDLGDHLSDDVAEDISYIQEASGRMQNLVQDLLTLSRAGKSEADMEEIDLNECLEASLDNLVVAVSESAAEVEFDSLPIIWGNSIQLSRVFQNIISNAIKFHGNGVPKIKISAEQQNKFWEFSISDDGIGIEEEHLEQIFGAFKRLHGRDEFSGTGIGLAIVRKVIERHGGVIWAESIKGKGTTFKFTIPIHPKNLTISHKRPLKNHERLSV